MPILGNGLLSCGTACMAVSVFSGWYYFVIQAARLTGRKRLFAAVKEKFEWCPFRIEEILLVSTVLTTTWFLVSRVLTGQCPPGTTIFLQQTCNQHANSGGIPPEMVYGIYWFPLMAQLMIRNVSIRTLALTSIAGFATVAFCIIYGNLWNDYFVMITWIWYSNASFEIERLQRIGYTQTLKLLDQKELELEQVKQERTMQEVMAAQQLKLDRTEDEKRLKESEALQLRSLMGNVAHDLKTPLFTIEADVETLKMIVEAIPDDVINNVVARMREAQHDDGSDDDIEPRTIFDSLWATIRFMIAGKSSYYEQTLSIHPVKQPINTSCCYFLSTNPF